MGFYSEMVSRNWAFISPEEQEKISNTKILLAGCGLGSNIGVLAVQTGFTQLVVVDHDVVEISNLNRQAFDRHHLGQNKALALKSILEEKSEVVEVEACPVRITLENAKEFISKAEIVVNTVDFDETVYTINDIARTQEKPSFFPMNIGWAHGFCLVFIPKSTTLEEMTGGKIANDETKFFPNLLENIKNYRLPDYLLQTFEEVMKSIEERKYPPQLGVGASCISVIVLDSMVRFLLSQSLKIAPEPMTILDTLHLPRIR